MEAAVAAAEQPIISGEAAAIRPRFDRGRLDAMHDRLAEWGIRSVVVVKDGQTAWQWHEHGQDRPTAIYSCTKSILSALAGIAIGEGMIGSIEDPISEYLPLPGDADPRLRQIRIRHLLAMTPGFDWPDFDKPYNAMKRSDDWVRFVLMTPVVHEPGEAFTYNSGGSHLLAAIIARVTGRPVLRFATDVLFGPLGMRQVRWNEQNGIHEGGTGLHLRAADLAKFGVLYAQGGRWAGSRIVPESWIADSTTAVTKGLVNYKPSIYGSYGYHWWVSAGQPAHVPNYYFAFGYGGQYLAIAPEAGLVAVVRRALTGRNDALKSRMLLHEYIFPSFAEHHH